MIINFDTATLNRSEAQAINAFLSSLFSISGQNGSNLEAQSVSDPTSQSILPSVPAVSGPVLVQSSTSVPTSAPTSEPEAPASRRRRTRAQIEADEAAALAVRSNPGDPTPGVSSVSAVPDAVASATIQPVVAPVDTAVVKPVTAEELRNLLNSYISRHSMEDAIDQLKNFGCNRVTEALALEPAKLHALAAALRG